MTSLNVYITKATLYLLHGATSEEESFGVVHCAIVGTTESTFKFGCYNKSNEYICIGDIKSSNEMGANLSLHASRVSFQDVNRRSWSLEFSSEKEAQVFCANVAIAMFGASGQPVDSVVACDVSSGRAGTKVLPGDTVVCNFTSWVLQRGEDTGVPKLGSILESKNGYSVPSVPASNYSVTSDMKGFEGMLIGMGEGGHRFAVIPSECFLGNGPKISLCFYMCVTKKASAVPPSVLESNAIVSKNPIVVPPGLSRDQFLFVDRLRDHVFTLTEQLREARRQLESFSADVNTHISRDVPGSIRSAQVEYSLKKLMSETTEFGDAVIVKSSTLSVMRERNEDLQAQLAKIMLTRKNLSDEITRSQNASTEEVIRLDQQITNLQERLSIVSVELDDSSRHLNLLKNNLNDVNEALQKTKSNFQVSHIASRASNQKLKSVQDCIVKETEARNVVQHQVEELKRSVEQINAECEAKRKKLVEKKTKMEGDKMYYLQMLEEERSQATGELSELRAALVAELEAYKERYAAEKSKAAEEAFQRGRDQGVSDGYQKAAMENDMTSQQLTITIRRIRAEEETLRTRLKTTEEESENEKKLLQKQIGALVEAENREVKESLALKNKLKELELVAVSEKERLFLDLKKLFSSSTIQYSQRSLFSLYDSLLENKAFDQSVLRRDLEDAKRLQKEEKTSVKLWTRSTAYNTPCRIPPVRFPFTCAEPHDFSSKAQVLSLEPDHEGPQREVLLQRQYQQAMSQLNATEPSLGLGS